MQDSTFKSKIPFCSFLIFCILFIMMDNCVNGYNKLKKSKKHIVVGLSGGVDSSVAALSLLQQGYEVTGVFMQNWEAEIDDPYCNAQQDLADAKAVCNKLGITLRTVNFAKEYWENVFNNFLDTLALGKTPNPDILCNREIKFKAFLNYALNLGASTIATGHYAQIKQNAETFELEKAVDSQKDQTYFLHGLDQFQLSHSLFPIGQLTKHKVRQIAQEAGFINSGKKDSTGICFIGERKFRDFLSEYLLAQPGNIETVTGDILGKHQGLLFYTLGQRQGLGIGGHRQYCEKPWYVLQKDIDRNVLVVGQEHDHPLLLNKYLTCNQVNWISKIPEFPLYCSAKIRYRQEDQSCTIEQIDDNTYRVEFLKPQRAITPGQSVVFYQNSICLGGGVIDWEKQ